jgi:Holliday junction resolvase RusA-like endonuclease
VIVAIEYEGRLVPYTRMTQRSKWGPGAQRYLASREGLQWVMVQAMQRRERWERTPLAVIIQIDGINRRADTDNIVKAVLDAANGIIWDDDRWVDAIQVRRVPAEQDRVRIWVREIGQQDA